MLPILSVVEAPEPVITLADAKAHLRVESADDDAVIEGFVSAATVDLDGATGWLGRALGQQTLSLTGGHFPGGSCPEFGVWDWAHDRITMYHPQEMRLHYPPVQSIGSVTYFDAFGTAQSLDPSLYHLVDRYVLPAPRTAWPATAPRPDAVTVTYVAGYAPGKLPAPIRAAILLKLGALYGTRADFALQAESTASALLTPWRIFA